MIVLLVFIASLSAGGFLFLEQKQFGKLPSGERLKRIERSVNYKNGAFQNQHFTPDLAEGNSERYVNEFRHARII